MDFEFTSEVSENLPSNVYINKNTQSNELHCLRLSIEVVSISDCKFNGNIYVKWSQNDLFSITSAYRTHPCINIKTSVEYQFSSKGSFQQYEFEMNQNQLYQAFQENSITFLVFHQDNMSQDQLIGSAVVNLEAVLKSKVKKTETSFARVFDGLLRVDSENGVCKAMLRARVFLEDLGPKEKIKRIEEQVHNMGQTQEEKLQGGNQEIRDLEEKVVFELEQFKQNEEQKFKIDLKQKEIQFLEELQNDWQKKEQEKDKRFKQAEASILLLEKKVKEKANELMKREQKLILVEEELKNKIKDIARQLANKEEEQLVQKKRYTEDLSKYQRENKQLQTKYDQNYQQIESLQQQVNHYKNENPVDIVKNELSIKNTQLVQLKDENMKLKEQVEQIKNLHEKQRIQTTNSQKDVEILKAELKFKEQEINILTQKQNENNNPNKLFTNNYFYEQDYNIPTKQQTSQQQFQQISISQQSQSQNDFSDLQKLQLEKQQYLEMGYSPDDDFIQDLNQQINNLL